MNRPSPGGSHLFSAVLSRAFPEPVGTVLDAFPFECGRGEIVVLLGPSGCGKTTFLNLLAGLLPPDGLPDTHSTVHLPLHGLAYSYAFQQPEAVPWRRCGENVYLETDASGMHREDVSRRVGTLMRLVGLGEYASLMPMHLSAGMLQRLQIVRSVARRTSVLLADEPLGAVDQPLRIHLAEEFRRLLKEDGTAAVWVTHDTLEAVAVADRVVVVAGKPLQVVAEHIVRRGTEGSGAPDAAEREPRRSLPDEQAARLRSILLSGYEKERGAARQPTRVPSERPEERPNRRRPIFSALVPLVPALLAWEGAVLFHPPLRFFLSSPAEWIPVFMRELLTGGLAGHAVTTVREAASGVGIGLPAGVCLGYLTASSPYLSSAIRPYWVGLTAVPLFVFAPAFILWFGVGEGMKVAVAALSCLPFVAYQVHDAAMEAKGSYYRYLLLSGAHRRRLFQAWVVPRTLGAVLDASRPAAVSALIGAFLGEFIAAERGLGYYIVLQASRYHIAEVLSGVLLLFLVAILVDTVFRRISIRRNDLIARLAV